nr:hypothetical protein orf173 [Navicula sp.]WPV72675.1 hypothetical protein orf173 [Navicula sp.]
MKKRFNFTGYKKLVDMENCGEIVFIDENYFKFLRYQTSVGKQLIYNRKEDYYSLINKYLNKTLTLLEFRTQFLNMEDEDLYKGSVILGDSQELEVFYLVEDLEKFSRLIGQISDLCQDYYIIEPMPETEFYFLVNKYSHQLQEAFPLKNSTNIEYEHLIFRSFTFLLFTIEFL